MRREDYPESEDGEGRASEDGGAPGSVVGEEIRVEDQEQGHGGDVDGMGAGHASGRSDVEEIRER